MKLLTVLLIVLVFIFALHLTPSLALRTHVFFKGYPLKAISTDIVDDEHHNTVDEKELKKENAKCYSLTKPPIESATDSELRNYKVTRKGILYVAEYYGDG